MKRRIPKALFAVLALTAFACGLSLPGQDAATPVKPKPVTLEQAWVDDLASLVPRRMIAAAVAIGDAGCTAAGPQLCRALAAAQRMDDDAGRIPALAILDALIRVRAETSSEDLDAHARGDALPAVMVLASRAPKRHFAVLQHVFSAQVESCAQLAWFVAGEILSHHPNEDFARAVFDGIKLRATGQVYESGVIPQSLGAEFEHSRLTQSKFCRSHRGLAHFGYYHLQNFKTQGAHRLATLGKKGIFAQRWATCPAGKICERCSHQWVVTESQRLNWASRMLKTTAEKLPVREFNRFPLFYRGPAAYRRDVKRIREDLRGRVRAVIARFRSAGIIRGKQPVELQIEVAVRIEDFRPDESPKLPALEGVLVTKLDPSVLRQAASGEKPKARKTPSRR